MTDFNVNFGVEWAAAVKEVSNVTVKTLQDSYEELFSRIVDDTPVDTGRLKGNWQMSLNSELDGETDELDADGSGVKNKAKSILASMTIDTKSVYVSNNVPYAEAIEYGHSQLQAPNGMVRVNMDSFSDIVTQMAQKNGKL